jgi:mannose-6-phosphate isomerase-like protein (cupin superfamily)
MKAIRYDPAEGLRRSARGNEMFFKATGDTTNGRFSLMERTVQPGAMMPPAHRHVGTEEAFFVLEGAVVFHIEGTILDGGTGAFVLVPAASRTRSATRATPRRDCSFSMLLPWPAT